MAASALYKIFSPSSNVKVKGQRSRTTGHKNEIMSSHSHWQCTVRRRMRCSPYTARSNRQVHCVAAGGDGSARWRWLACSFVGSSPRGRGYTGGKISTGCL